MVRGSAGLKLKEIKCQFYLAGSRGSTWIKAGYGITLLEATLIPLHPALPPPPNEKHCHPARIIHWWDNVSRLISKKNKDSEKRAFLRA